MQGKIFLLLIIIVGGKISMKIVLQDGISDCGICCLLSIIKYYNGSVSKEYLREITNTTKNGVTAFNLLEASKKLGFEVCILPEVCRAVMPQVTGIRLVGVGSLADVLNYLRS